MALMTCVRQRLVLLWVALMLLGASVSLAQKIEILKPLKDTGDEVALIFTTSENGLEGEQYRQIATAIQESSNLRIWVALNEYSYKLLAGLYPVPKAPEDSIRALKKAGMTSKNYVGVAHGKCADYLLDSAPDSELKAVILMGYPMERDAKLQDYPLPVLTLAGELDGIARITRMAEVFAKLKEGIVDSFANLYKAPLLLLEGVNHGQFASGTMPLYVINNDLIPTVSDETARRMVGEYVDIFLVVTFSSSPPEVDDAMRDIEIGFAKSIEKFQPILDLKALDMNGGNVSRWTILAQEFIAGEFDNRIQVSNVREEISLFSSSKPSVTGIGGGRVAVKTYSFEQNRDGSHASVLLTKESPYETGMKLVSKDAIWEALAAQDNGVSLNGPQTSLRSKPVSCKNLNELAFKIALNHSCPEAQRRYKEHGRPITFKEDFPVGIGWMWSLQPLLTWEDQFCLSVKSVAYVQPITSTVNPGLMYCKVITPSLAMEWVNVDSLRKRPVIG